MPVLKDTEWRLLCVIVRQTLGWQDISARRSHGPSPKRCNGPRKRRDWLTREQLKRRTGRDAEALSRAVAALIRQQLIQVESEEGDLLLTAGERRQAQGRLYYALHPRLTEKFVAKSEQQDRKIEHQDHKNEQKERKSEHQCAVKTNTTKETFTKRMITEEVMTKETAAKIFQVKAQDTTSDEITAHRAVQEQLPADLEPEVMRLIETYEQKYKYYIGSLSPAVSPGEDATHIQALLARYPYEQLCELLDIFFTARLSWIERQSYSLSAFTGSINFLRLKRRHADAKA